MVARRLSPAVASCWLGRFSKIDSGRVLPLHCPPSSGKVNGGNPIDRRPRLRLAIYAAHRAPHPRTKRLLRRPPLHRLAERNQELRARRHHPLRRPVVRLRRRRSPRGRTGAASRPAGAGHLLRTALHDPQARRQGQPRRQARVRTRRRRTPARRLRPVQGTHRPAARLDVARRRGRGTSAGLPAWSRRSSNAKAAFEDPARKYYAVQFHPEVHHTKQGTAILRNFVFDICGLTPTGRRSASSTKPSPPSASKSAPAA